MLMVLLVLVGVAPEERGEEGVEEVNMMKRWRWMSCGGGISVNDPKIPRHLWSTAQSPAATTTLPPMEPLELLAPPLRIPTHQELESTEKTWSPKNYGNMS
jgi:hypothetical protein